MDEEAFLDALYGLCLDDTFLDDILPFFAAVMGTHSSNYAAVDLSTGHIHQKIIGIDPDYLARNGPDCLAKNPWVNEAYRDWSRNPAAWAAPRSTHGAELIPVSAYRETEYYRDFNRFTGAGDDMITTHAPIGTRMVGLAASTGGRIFGEAERGRAQRLLPHIARALRLHARFAERSFLDAAHAGGPPATPAFTLRQGRLARANGAARRMLAAGILFGERNGCVTARHPEALDAARAAERGARHQACVIDSEAGRWLIHAVRSDAPEALARMGDGAPAITVFVTPLDTGSATRIDALGAFAQLTAAERQVLALLGDGLDAPAIASRLDRSRETVRSHIARLRLKLHAGSQADLARIAALLQRTSSRTGSESGMEADGGRDRD